jgi:ribosomal protein S12 methylthiotransferase accessory factor
MSNNSASLARLLDVLDWLVDDCVGIVRFVVETRPQAGAPKFFHYYAEACTTQALGGEANFRRSGGASTISTVARAKAVGEAVERYCSALYKIEELPLHSYHKAPFRCVPPEEFALYSKEQYTRLDFKFVPFERTTPTRWVPSKEILSGEVWYVPAAMVYVPYTYYLDLGDNPIAQPISTGLACHTSPEEAMVSAVCEVVERDAFTIAWQAQLSLPKIPPGSLSLQNQDRVNRFEQVGYSVTLFNLTLDTGIPTILSVSRSEASGRPAMVVAAAADPSSEGAVRKSLEELAHTLKLCQNITSNMARLVSEPGYTNINDQLDHLNFWCDRTNLPLADFLFASDKQIEFHELPNLSVGNSYEDLKVLLEQIHSLGHRVLMADLTTDDVKALGLTVVRAIIPGFHPLFMGYNNRALGGHRLWTVPQKLGFEGISIELGERSIPHPYP